MQPADEGEEIGAIDANRFMEEKRAAVFTKAADLAGVEPTAFAVLPPAEARPWLMQASGLTEDKFPDELVVARLSEWGRALKAK